MSNFWEDLERGKIYEKKALELYGDDLKSYEEPNENDRPFYDYKLTKRDGSIEYIEVKADYKGEKTGNFALEYECNNKISGIDRTRADYYIIFIIGVGIYKVKTDILKKMSGRIVSGGDYNKSKMRLIPIQQLQEYRIK